MINSTKPHSTKSQTVRPFFHVLSSKKAESDEILILSGYDYFLQKKDLKQLLQKYYKIILVPRSVDDDLYLGTEIGKILTKYHKIHLVNNPTYDQQHQIIYHFAVKNSKILRTNTVYEYCETILKKTYIPESMDFYEEMTITLRYFSIWTRIFKKSVDWGVGVLLLCCTSPLWLLAFFRIKTQSPGPAFYRQKRVGIKNNEFWCAKFRSMRLDAEQNGAQFSSKNDDRTFPFGKFMRTTRIDELPQLLNIVKGEMSLVGPRPERRIFTDAFEENMLHYAQRHVVKPGISGYAQVMYPYGAGVKDARHKLMYDLYYIKNWSVGLEMEIIWKTVWIVLFKKGL